jgi:hypothetical protein
MTKLEELGAAYEAACDAAVASNAAANAAYDDARDASTEAAWDVADTAACDAWAAYADVLDANGAYYDELKKTQEENSDD